MGIRPNEACAARRRSLGIASLLIWALAAAHAHADTSGEQLALDAGRSLIGTPAPRLVLTTIDGERIDLGRLYGKQAVYLKFWATWCVPCRQQMPHFQHIYETAGTDLAVIAINTGFNDSIDEVRAYRARLGITMPIVIDDGQLAGALHLRVTPQHVVIGRDGRIEYVGHLADAPLEAALAKARGTAVAGPAELSGPTGITEPPAGYRVGELLPNLSPLTLDGPRFQLRQGSASGRTVLVFLSPWCESYLSTTRPALAANCRRMREQVNKLAAGPGTVRWLGIASGLWATPEDLRAYRGKYRVRIPLSLDESGALFRAFRVNEVPAAIVADGGGRILRKVAANDLDTPTALRAAVEVR